MRVTKVPIAVTGYRESKARDLSRKEPFHMEHAMPKNARSESSNGMLSLRSRLFVHLHHLAIALTLAWVFWLLFLKG